VSAFECGFLVKQALCLSAAAVCVLVSACAATVDEPVDDVTGEGEGETVDDVARADCAVPVVSSIALQEGIVEDNPDFDAQFAAIDLDALPSAVSFADESAFIRSIVAYSLDIPAAGLDGSVPVDELRALGVMGDVVAASFAGPNEAPGVLDFAFFRQGYHRFAACVGGWPLTLADFKRVYGDPTSTVEPVLLTNSRPKAPHPRRLWSDDVNGLWLAETLESEGDDTVHETEIVLRGQRVDGALDFIVYDDVGQLSAVSRFATGGGTGSVQTAAPYTCLFCHGNADTLAFDVVHPQ
jgi:hypothetical protein